MNNHGFYLYSTFLNKVTMCLARRNATREGRSNSKSKEDQLNTMKTILNVSKGFVREKVSRKNLIQPRIDTSANGWEDCRLSHIQKVTEAKPNLSC